MKTSGIKASVSLPEELEMRSPLSQVEAFGLNLTNATESEVLLWLMKQVKEKRKNTINFINAHCINVASQDDSYYRVLRNSQHLLPDGSGIRMALTMRGITLKANLNGTDMFPSICEHAAERGFSLYLMGAEPGIAQKVASNMQRRYPKLCIAGVRNGFFSQEEEPAVVDQINQSGAHILLVAMGVPKQEVWLERNQDRLNTVLNFGVGGLFDFYSEQVSRAPLFLRKLGLEWVWRLLQEPGRMWRRYILGNPLFVFRAWLDRRRHDLFEQLNLGIGGQSSASFIHPFTAWLLLRASANSKRLLDVFVSIGALTVLSPIILMLAIITKLDSPGPVFFSQTRVGRKGVPFRFWKIRSMHVDAEDTRSTLMDESSDTHKILFKLKKDPRITRVGKYIRRYSLDELPQLWNVLLGDMSLVGPRPALLEEVEQYNLNDRKRLTAVPGVTGIWQTSGRSDTPFKVQVEMDLQYIRYAGIWTDVKLLLKTIPAVISGRGAY